MIKQNKWKILITSIVILLPIVAGLILWNKLPDQIAIHFNAQNQPDNWANKWVTVFVLPIIVLVIHLVSIFVTYLDKRNNNISPAVINICLWICPIASLITSSLTYAIALGYKINVGFVVLLFLGGLFVLMGNYLPKCKQNSSIGIRLPWTQKDSDNWNKTHRLAGWVMTISGLILIATAFLTNVWLSIAIIILTVIIPGVYSFVYYLRHKNV